MLYPAYAYIVFDFQGKEIAGSGRWFETTSSQAATGYVAGYNAGSLLVKARLVEFRSESKEPPSDLILKMFP